MKYSNDPDYKRLRSLVRDASPVGRVQISASPKGGYVCNARTPRCHVRVWGPNADCAMEAVRCALTVVIHGS